MLVESPELHGKNRVFRDRAEAGRILAALVEAPSPQERALVAGIPAGGIPVAAVLAAELHLPLVAAVVSKVTLPWNSEAGYGAVAFDGSSLLNEEMVLQTGLTAPQVTEGVKRTREKVRRRHGRFSGITGKPDFSGRSVILVDDGLASGFTMRVAVAAIRGDGAARIVVAVPTGHGHAVRTVESTVEAVYCANVREGMWYAVADAYRHWSDVDEDEVERLLRDAAGRF